MTQILGLSCIVLFWPNHHITMVGGVWNVYILLRANLKEQKTKQYCHIILPDSLELALKIQQKYLTFFSLHTFFGLFYCHCVQVKKSHNFWLHRGCTDVASCREVFQMFSRGFPEVFQRFSGGFQEVFRRFSGGFQEVFQGWRRGVYLL